MSVLLNTSAGDLVIDLYTDSCPIATKNFLKLCKIKFYNNCLFYNVQQNFVAQTGDPTGTGKGGNSIYGIVNGDAGYFKDEVVKGRKLNKVGLVVMAHSGNKEDSNRSQFFITLRGEDMEQFEGSHTIFAEVAEGFEVLEKINSLYCHEDGRPFQDVRILHTYILDDPFPDIPGMVVPSASPECTRPEQERVKPGLAYSEKIEDDADGKTAEELDASIRRKEAKSRAIMLEMTGDLPDADVKPPDEVLFICKLNPVTTDEDLELIFSRFGTIKSCEVIRDFKTGDSLNYAFVEFETAAACIEAYEKMNNVLIDDRRIKVDFSQSVSKLWNRFLLQPRKSGPGDKSAPKPGEKPSYYMRQPGMSSAAAPASVPALDRKPTPRDEGNGRERNRADPYQPSRRGTERSGENQSKRDRSKDRERVRSRSRDRHEKDSHARRDRDRRGERLPEQGRRETDRDKERDTASRRDKEDHRDRDRRDARDGNRDSRRDYRRDDRREHSREDRRDSRRDDSRDRGKKRDRDSPSPVRGSRDDRRRA
jgi:peptidyl-prolyl cis-trans isomerase-like 4